MAVIFIRKKKGEIEQARIFGSIKAMVETEEIIIDGKIMKASQLYWLFADKCVLDTADFYIKVRTQIKRKKHE